jgi:ligand-binding sensor domain-containing protein/signal transduction histidine kinase
VSMMTCMLAQNFIHITKNSGLSQSSVTALLQDEMGFLWVGTQDGLNRYNGNDFVIYRLDHTDSLSISNNEINDIIQARDGSYWVATAQGVNRLKYTFSDNFIRYFHDSNDENSLVNDYALMLEEDQDGNIWIGTRSGLSRLNPETGEFTNFLEENTSPYIYPNNRIYDIFEDSYGRIFVSTSFNSMIYNVETKTLDTLENLKYVTDFFEDDRRQLWVGMLEEGLVKYDASTQKRLKVYDADFTTITKIEQVNEQELWLGTNDKGIVIFNLDEERFSQFEENDRNKHLHNLEYISDLEKGINDIVWISAGIEGFCKYDPNQVTFQHITHKPTDPNSLSSRFVWSIMEDHKGNVWIATNDAGVNRIDYKTHKITHYWGKENNGPLPSNSIVALFEDNQNRIWIGTNNQGTVIYDPNKNTYTELNRDQQKGRGYYFNSPSKFVQDDDDTIWMGTEYGIYRLDPNTFQSKQFVPDTSLTSFDDVNAINDILIDGDYLWIATRYGGLYKFDKEREQFVDFEHKSDDFPVHPYIMALHKDRYGNLWIGTLQGLNRFDFRDNKKYTYTHKDGLPNDVIYGIQEDVNGNLWVSTNNGLSKIDLTDRDNIIFDNFDYQNQIQSLEYNQYSHHRGKVTNNLYFGGVNGINIIEPDDIHTKTPTPTAYISSINIDGQRLPVIKDHSDLEFSYEYNLIEFEFSAIQYTDPKKINFEYQLVGFNDNWIKLGKKNHINFTNLPGADYELKIKAYTNDSEKNYSFSIVNFNVIPPVWQVWWFKALMFVFVIFLIYAIIKLRLNNMRREKIILEKKVDERTAIIKNKMDELVEANTQINKQTDDLINANSSLESALNDLHHEKQKNQTMIELIVHDLKNPLNNILTLSNQKPSKQDLDIINQSGNQILNLSMNLLETAKFEHDSINLDIEHCNLYKLVTEAFAQVKLLAKQKNISFVNEVVPVIFVKVDFEIILRVFINLFTNAVKNSFYNGVITVKHEIVDSDIIISVRDNGKGIPQEKIDQIFDKYSRVENLDDKTIRSSGLGLTFCKLALERHEGKIWAESVEDEYTTIFLQLPLSTVKNMTEEVIEPKKPEKKKFDFTDEQVLYLKPFISKLKKLTILDISDIIEILDQVGTSDKMIKEWGDKVKYAALNMEEEHFDNLLNVNISENA